THARASKKAGANFTASTRSGPDSPHPRVLGRILQLLGCAALIRALVVGCGRPGAGAMIDHSGQGSGLSLDRPRRIFNGSPRLQGRGGPDIRGRVVLAGLAGTVFGAIVMLFALPTDLFGRVPTLSGTVTVA